MGAAGPTARSRRACSRLALPAAALPAPHAPEAHRAAGAAPPPNPPAIAAAPQAARAASACASSTRATSSPRCPPTSTSSRCSAQLQTRCAAGREGPPAGAGAACGAPRGGKSPALPAAPILLNARTSSFCPCSRYRRRTASSTSSYSNSPTPWRWTGALVVYKPCRRRPRLSDTGEGLAPPPRWLPQLPPLLFPLVPRMLPGLKPTGKFVSVPFIVVVDFEGDKVGGWPRGMTAPCPALPHPPGLPRSPRSPSAISRPPPPLNDPAPSSPPAAQGGANLLGSRNSACPAGPAARGPAHRRRGAERQGARRGGGAQQPDADARRRAHAALRRRAAGGGRRRCLVRPRPGPEPSPDNAWSHAGPLMMPWRRCFPMLPAPARAALAAACCGALPCPLVSAHRAAKPPLVPCTAMRSLEPPCARRAAGPPRHASLCLEPTPCPLTTTAACCFAGAGRSLGPRPARAKNA
jgi:hypothetical protein